MSDAANFLVLPSKCRVSIKYNVAVKILIGGD